MPESQRVLLPALTDSQQGLMLGCICWDSDEFTRSVMHSCWDHVTALLPDQPRARPKNWVRCGILKRWLKIPTLLWHTLTNVTLSQVCKQNRGLLMLKQSCRLPICSWEWTAITQTRHDRKFSASLIISWVPWVPWEPRTLITNMANKSLYLHDMRLLSSSPCTLAFFLFSPIFFLRNRCFCSY